MSSYSLELGQTDGFQYIGIKPPLAEEDEMALDAARATDKDVLSHFQEVNPDQGEAYSQLGFSTEGFMSQLSIETATQARASKIAAVLKSRGHTVEIDTSLHTIGYGYSLFGGQANRLG